MPSGDRRAVSSETSTEFTIQRAAPSDAPALADIQATASVAAFARIFPPDRYPFPTAAVRERWETALAAGTAEVYVAIDDGRPVGLVAVKPGWLEALYVLPSHWGTRAAPQLHDLALERLAERGTRTAKLWVLEHNDRARAFYERRGWRPNGETRVVPFPPEPLDVGYTLELGPLGAGPPRL
jgi:GNAT superfamily N-acetyltransferase